MKKTFYSIIIAVLIFVVAFFAARWFWTSPDAVNGQIPGNNVTGSLPEEGYEFEQASGMQSYENGLAAFSYDSDKVIFLEMPSSDENGYPMTSFLLKDDENVLPRLDVIPLKLEEPFSQDVTVDDWQELVRALLLAYYNTEEQSRVVINFADGVVKVDEDSAKMYMYVTCTLDGSATPNMNGVIRLVGNNKSAIITLALAEKGFTIPDELEDIYMSVTLD